MTALEREAAARSLLSPREIEAVRWAAEGLSNPEIARAMGLSLHTVKNYLLHVHQRLGTRSRTAAVVVTGIWRIGAPRPAGRPIPAPGCAVLPPRAVADGEPDTDPPTGAPRAPGVEAAVHG